MPHRRLAVVCPMGRWPLPRPRNNHGETKMKTLEELKHMAVVESSLREIAEQLRIKNGLEEFRLRKEYPSRETDRVIDAIMGGGKCLR